MHKSSNISPSLLYYKEAGKDCWKNAKRETQRVSKPIRIRSGIYLARHIVTSRYCFAHFQKWKRSGLVDSQKLKPSGEIKKGLESIIDIGSLNFREFRGNNWK